MRFDVNTDALWPKGLREGGNGFFGIETEHKLHVERPTTNGPNQSDFVSLRLN